MGRSGAQIMNIGGVLDSSPLLGSVGSMAQVQSSPGLSQRFPFSFKTALDQIEEEILNLAAEVAFCRKEVMIQKTEQDTVATVAKTQCADIERYLNKEVEILDNVITQQQDRQNIEFKRLH